MNSWRQILSSTQTHQLEVLSSWSNMNTGSHNLAGLHQFCDTLTKAFEPFHAKITRHPLPSFQTFDLKGRLIEQKTGDLLWIQQRPHLQRRVLLSAHMDTIYSALDPFQKATWTGQYLQGPGVADMKGGILVIKQALELFETIPEASTLGWDIMITPDEEIGSPASHHFMTRIANRYRVAFVYEPSITLDGSLAKNRWGSGLFTILCHGRAAHAGRNIHDGRNAIVHLASFIQTLTHLHQTRPGVIVNIAQIEGGRAFNQVPDLAVLRLNVRVQHPEDAAWIEETFHHLIQRFSHHGFQIEIQGHFHRPIKIINEKTNALFHTLRRSGQTLHLDLTWQDTQGCCDGNNLHALGLTVLDTLGVRGGELHSPNEFMVPDSLMERSLLSALLLQTLAQGYLETL